MHTRDKIFDNFLACFYCFQPWNAYTSMHSLVKIHNKSTVTIQNPDIPFPDTLKLQTPRCQSFKSVFFTTLSHFHITTKLFIHTKRTSLECPGTIWSRVKRLPDFEWLLYWNDIGL